MSTQPEPHLEVVAEPEPRTRVLTAMMEQALDRAEKDLTVETLGEVLAAMNEAMQALGQFLDQVTSERDALRGLVDAAVPVMEAVLDHHVAGFTEDQARAWVTRYVREGAPR